MTNRTTRLATAVGAAVVMSAAILFPITATGQEPQSVDQALEKLQSLAGKIESFTADLEMRMNMMGAPMTMAGTMKMKGDRQVFEAKMNVMNQSMTSRGVMDADGIMWQEVEAAGMRQVMKMDMKKINELSSELSGLPASMLSGMGSPTEMYRDPGKMLEAYAEAFDLTLEDNETIDGVEVYVFSAKLKEDMKEQFDPTGMMKQMGFDMENTRIAVGVEDGLTRRTEMLGAGGEPVMTMNMKNVVINPELSDDLFVFTPPDGVEVMEMTETMIRNQKALLTGEPGGTPIEEYNTKFNVGDTAPEFEGAGLVGKTVKLSDYRGKVVLIDFWATWCGPCIAELPNVIVAYNKYKDRDFEIIGVSLDDETDALESFLKKRPAMSWPQIFDGKGWESPVGEQYGVQAIPFTLLLDKEGVIRGKDLRGPGLDEAIGELLGSE